MLDFVAFFIWFTVATHARIDLGNDLSYGPRPKPASASAPGQRILSPWRFLLCWGPGDVLNHLDHSRACLVNSATIRRDSIASAVVEAMLQAVPVLPFGAPPPAPCIRQTLCPLTAGDRHGFPLRFDVA